MKECPKSADNYGKVKECPPEATFCEKGKLGNIKKLKCCVGISFNIYNFISQLNRYYLFHSKLQFDFSNLMLGEHIARACAQVGPGMTEGCVNPKEETEKQAGAIAAAMVPDSDACLCKGDLCNASPVTRTTSVMTVLFASFLRNYF